MIREEFTSFYIVFQIIQSISLHEKLGSLLYDIFELCLNFISSLFIGGVGMLGVWMVQFMFQSLLFFLFLSFLSVE